MINYLHVLVAGLAAFTVGYVWYGPLFGKAWIKEVGFTEAEMAEGKKKGMMGTMLMGLTAVLVMTYALAWLLSALSVDSLTGGLQLAAGLWLGFVGSVAFMNKLFGKNKSTKLFLIDSLHYLAAMLVMAAILTLWK